MLLTLAKDLTALKVAGKAAVDAAAETARAAYLTEGAGQALEYAQKFDEAALYKSSGGAGKATWPWLDAHADALGLGRSAAADAIVAQAAVWTTAGSRISELRLGAKRQIDAATTPAQIDALIQVSWPTP